MKALLGALNKLIKYLKDKKGFDVNSISDGSHSFGELYEHRINLFVAYCKLLCSERHRGKHPVWKSKLHSDGTMFDGWFIMGIDTDRGNQISYHLPIREWGNTNFEGIEVFDHAPEWDGHTSEDILKRLKEL